MRERRTKPRLRGLTGLDQWEAPYKADQAHGDGLDAERARRWLLERQLWPLSADDLAWLAERDAARDRRRREEDLRAGHVVDGCPDPGPICEGCGSTDDLARYAYESHFGGTERGPLCASLCFDCWNTGEVWPWAGPEQAARVAEHVVHLGWDEEG
jgi:hypothetical protein